MSYYLNCYIEDNKRLYTEISQHNKVAFVTYTTDDVDNEFRIIAQEGLSLFFDDELDWVGVKKIDNTTYIEHSIITQKKSITISIVGDYNIEYITENGDKLLFTLK